MLKRLLIANRGEIACRILKTAQQLGIYCIAIYTYADRKSLHVQQANEAHYVRSYSDGEAIVALAQMHRVDAVHPGYGFLSESADFASLCEAQGVLFVGPDSHTIATMGDKAKARTIMEQAGIPVINGACPSEQSMESMIDAAEKIGYPVLLKPIKGGGGMGMYIAHTPKTLASVLPHAQQVAAISCGDATLCIEQYLPESRHIEVQIFGDHHGHWVHLFERDCSLQRKYQKIVEETPAGNLSATLRHGLREAALKAAKVVAYKNAGTVEFLVDKNEVFYFIEMNTRLQVEHPVTEMVIGEDLLAWQLTIASGAPLPCSQPEIRIQGHAIEARLYAEDPEYDFKPSAGKIVYMDFPEALSSCHHKIRVDSGFQKGDYVHTHYDPLLAKLIVWAENRPQAIAYMEKALQYTHIIGVATNRNFLLDLIQTPHFHQALHTTDYISRHREDGRNPHTYSGALPPKALFEENKMLSGVNSAHPIKKLTENDWKNLGFFRKPSSEHYALAGLCIYLSQHKESTENKSVKREDPHSPWFLKNHWHINLPEAYAYTWDFRSTREPHRVSVYHDGNDHYTVKSGTETLHYRAQLNDELLPTTQQCLMDSLIEKQELDPDGSLQPTEQGHTRSTRFFTTAHGIHLIHEKEHYFFGYYTFPSPTHHAAHSINICAPLPGTIVDIPVNIGDTVTEGSVLVVMEAMKMLHSIRAEKSVKIEVIDAELGRVVQEGSLLMIAKTR